MNHIVLIAAIALLREFHLRMEQTVYEFGGTLDKYLGDGVMVTFGTPRPTPQARGAGPHDVSFRIPHRPAESSPADLVQLAAK